MLRRVLLVVMATVVSYVLTACSGYILYTISDGRSEAHLSLMVRFLFNPPTDCAGRRSTSRPSQQ